MNITQQSKQPFVLSLILAGAAIWITVAVAAQYSYGLLYNNLVPANFFSFFTIQSNILAAITLALGALIPLRQQPRWFSYLRGVATLCIITTGIVYATLLSGLEQSLNTTLPWVNVALHYLSPLIVFAWWIAVPPRHQFSFKHNLLWLIIPLIYVVYSLVRGAFVQWYPYPFLNPQDGGYGKVAVMSVIIFAVLVAVVGALTWLSRRVRQ